MLPPHARTGKNHRSEKMIRYHRSGMGVPGAAYERRYACIRKRVVTADRLWIMRKMQADVAIRHEEPRGQATGWNEPVGVGQTELRRAGPEVPLIERQDFE